MGSALKMIFGRRAAFWLLCVAIVGGCGAMAYRHLAGQMTDDSMPRTDADIAMLRSTVIRVKQRHGHYPTNEEGLESLVGVYIKKQGLRDPWGNPYQYEFSDEEGDDGGVPLIWSLGKDGKDGTGDESYGR